MEDGATAGPAEARGRFGDLVAISIVMARPWLMAAGCFAAVVLLLRALPNIDATGPLMRIFIESVAIVALAIGVASTWWARRAHRSWDVEVWVALLGAIAALAILGPLRGTPFAFYGLEGDQGFRTEAITRFASSAALMDFTYHGLPAWYAPGFLWVLGRVADLAAIEPWRMLKAATALTAMGLPVLTFVLWRRFVPPRSAVLMAAVPLLIPNAYEPYSWIVIVAIVPWWLEVAGTPLRERSQPLHPVVLGIVGAVLCLTYYYFFFIAAIAIVFHVGAERWQGRPVRHLIRRVSVAFGTVVVLTAIFWLPLLLSLIRAPATVGVPNRYIPPVGTLPILQILDPTLTLGLAGFGLLALVVLSRGNTLARGLLVLVCAVGAWFVIGGVAALLGRPLVTFRGGPLAPQAMLYGAILGASRGLSYIDRRLHRLVSPDEVEGARRTASLVGATLAIAYLAYATASFLVVTLTDPGIGIAWREHLPDGRLLAARAPATTSAPFVSVDQLQAVIASRYRGPEPPVVLSTRTDLLALTTDFGFVQWHVYYSHPASQFEDRIAFLRQAASSADPIAFARETRDNRFDRIDAFVLKASGADLVFDYIDDNFPYGGIPRQVVFARSLVESAAFDVVDLGSYVVAVRR